MMRGVPPTRHGITTNTFQPLVRPVPSLFDVAAGAGLHVAGFVNWPELRDLADPASFRFWLAFAEPSDSAGDQAVAYETIRRYQVDPFDLAFVYFGYPDVAGHRFGWMSDPYLEAIAFADRCLGQVLAKITNADVIALADHGGHERTHGTDMPEDMTIPWIAAGPNVRAKGELQNVRIFDTCTTAAALLGLPMHPAWEGRNVLAS
jgi:predicted AlkP superfamily pyrophosphatase or phosphodiesterase